MAGGLPAEQRFAASAGPPLTPTPAALSQAGATHSHAPATGDAKQGGAKLAPRPAEVLGALRLACVGWRALVCAGKHWAGAHSSPSGSCATSTLEMTLSSSLVATPVTLYSGYLQNRGGPKAKGGSTIG